MATETARYGPGDEDRFVSFRPGRLTARGGARSVVLATAAFRTVAVALSPRRSLLERELTSFRCSSIIKWTGVLTRRREKSGKGEGRRCYVKGHRFVSADEFQGVRALFFSVLLVFVCRSGGRTSNLAVI